MLAENFLAFSQRAQRPVQAGLDAAADAWPAESQLSEEDAEDEMRLASRSAAIVAGSARNAGCASALRRTSLFMDAD